MKKIRFVVKKYFNILIGKGKPGRKLVRAAEGSVTILLLVIMLPTLVFSFSVLDICKIFLANDVVSEATDIALRSSLTSYDDVLKDMYGIMASSKSDEEFIDNAAKYYEATLSSSGMSAEEQSTTLEFIKELLGTSLNEDMFDNNNFLKVFPGGEIGGKNHESISISGVPESAASNPNVLHRQIVEYMKYRGPVIIAAGLFDKINAFKDLPNQADVLDKQITYEKTVADVGNKTIKAYTLLRVYDYNNKILMGQTASLADMFAIKERKEIIDKNKYAYDQAFSLEELKSSAGTVPGAAQAINELKAASAYIAAIYAYTPAIVKKGSPDIELIAPLNTKDSDDPMEKMTEGYDKITKNADYKTLYDEIKNKRVKSDIEEMKKICMGDFSADQTKANKGFELLKALAPMYKNCSNEMIDQVNKDFSSACKQFMSYYNKLYKNGEETPEQDYKELYDQITAAENVVKEQVKSFYNEAKREFESASNTLNKLYDAMSKQSGIIDSLLGNEVGLQKIYQEFQQAKTDAEEYKKSIDKVETETQKNSNMAQYESEAQDFSEMKQEDVDSMINALKEQKVVYDRAMQSMKYVIFLKNFGSTNKIIDASKKGGDHLHNTNFNDYIKNYNEDAFGQNSFSNICSGIQSDKDVVSFNPFDPSGINYNNWSEFFPKATDSGQNPFYKKLEELSKPKSDKGNTEEGKDLKKKVTEKVEVNEDGQPKTDKDSDKDSGGTSSIPYNTDFDPTKIDTFSKHYASTQVGDGKTLSGDVKSGTDNDKNMASNAQNLLRSLTGYLQGLGQNLGESILVTTYITGQFSCYTTNMDGKGKRGTDETMITGYKFCEGDKTNVEWYGAEQEYILYGLKTPEANIAAASAAIYAIRFVLNLIYSFTDPEITRFTTSVATAAGGIFPLSIPLIKTALHIGLSLAESAYDLMKLKQGADVPFYKTKTTWMCKGSNIIRNISADALETVGSKVIDAAENRINKFVGKSFDNLAEMKSEMKDEIDGMLADEKDKLISQVKTDLLLPLELSIQQCIINFGDSPDIKVKLKTALNDACGRIEENLGLKSVKPDDDNILKAVEKEVFGSIKGMIGGYADQIADHIGEYIDAATGANISQFENQQSQEYLGAFSDKMEKLFSGAVDAIFKTVEKFEDKISGALDDALSKLCEKTKKGVKLGADEVRDAIGSASNKLRGQGHLNTEIKSKGEKTSAASMVSMSYQDYLTIFMLISVTTGDANQLERMSQLITGNIRKVIGSDDYDLNKAYTLFKAEGAATVRTIFFGAVYEDGKLNLSNNPGKYSFTHSAYLGY